MRVVATVHAEPRQSIGSPSFRVHFWERTSAERAWNLDAFVLIGARDVGEVLRWAEEHARGRHLEIFVEGDEQPASRFDVPRTAALLRLLGSDPNEVASTATVPFVRAEGKPHRP
ncbi:hypothetical protein ACFOE1_12140 [Agromyces mediolanus]|uniref:Uncharacterized protein n=1 Tax=Agromyces mediolanus TaxID=41986 RepID=A0A918CAJ7_AGRME|nr:hypothetical protein [Agromyces mediolanus]GGR14446.1 hypothetical protein GCM10010196_03810 [Agromyces mediolanus]GLJ72785.1 hypothetical protein GCM10017583_20410 [Agromyces mediolanus]